tara:strand:- start:489 stop:755 length:267 start_codon:yes stop_codon:yes gene_type:complete
MNRSSTLSDYLSRRALLQALVGGGIRAGDVHGARARWGAYPTGEPVPPDDLVATVMHRFGISGAAQIYDNLGRLHAAGDGKPALDLLA